MGIFILFIYSIRRATEEIQIVKAISGSKRQRNDQDWSVSASGSVLGVESSWLAGTDGGAAAGCCLFVVAACSL